MSSRRYHRLLCRVSDAEEELRRLALRAYDNPLTAPGDSDISEAEAFNFAARVLGDIVDEAEREHGDGDDA